MGICGVGRRGGRTAHSVWPCEVAHGGTRGRAREMGRAAISIFSHGIVAAPSPPPRILTPRRPTERRPQVTPQTSFWPSVSLPRARPHHGGAPSPLWKNDVLARCRLTGPCACGRCAPCMNLPHCKEQVSLGIQHGEKCSFRRRLNYADEAVRMMAAEAESSQLWQFHCWLPTLLSPSC